MKLRRPVVKLLVLFAVLLAGCATESDWKRAKATNTARGYAEFLAKHPQGAHVDESKAAIEGIEWKDATLANTPVAFLKYYRDHPESSRIAAGDGTVASSVTLHANISYGLSGTATSEPVITIDNATVAMSTEYACKLGILSCSATCYGGIVFETRPPRKAKIFRETTTRRILALQFPDKSTSKPEDAINDAAISGDTDEIEALLKDKPDLVFGVKTFPQNTPLHEAASFGNVAAVALLLASHADANAKDGASYVPLHCAAANGHKDVAALLLARGANVNAKGMLGDETPLHLAAEHGYRDVVELLLANKADVNAKMARARTPLQLAVENGHKDVVELLLANDADVNAKDDDGWTPLRYAAGDGQKGLAELLRQKGAHE